MAKRLTVECRLVQVSCDCKGSDLAAQTARLLSDCHPMSIEGGEYSSLFKDCNLTCKQAIGRLGHLSYTTLIRFLWGGGCPELGGWGYQGID